MPVIRPGGALLDKPIADYRGIPCFIADCFDRHIDCDRRLGWLSPIAAITLEPIHSNSYSTLDLYLGETIA